MITTDKRRFGWNIIAKSLENDIDVVNLPIKIRKEKLYVYPDDRGDKLAAAIKLLRIDPDAAIDEFENESQQKFIDWMRWLIRDDSPNAIFIFNTGKLRYNDCHIVPGSIWTTASGFKSFVEWYMRGAPRDCRIDTFDRNQQSLDLWKHIHSQWDGEDFYQFVRSYDENCHSEDVYCWGNKLSDETIPECSVRQIKEIEEYFGTHENMVSYWKVFQALEHRYHHFDIVSYHQTLLDNLVDRNSNANLIWINNIFFFRRNILKYGIAHLQQSLLSLLIGVHDRASNTKVWGQCAAMHMGHPVHQIIQYLETHPIPQHQCDLYEYEPHFVQTVA